jgi:hypothetical protein
MGGGSIKHTGLRGMGITKTKFLISIFPIFARNIWISTQCNAEKKEEDIQSYSRQVVNMVKSTREDMNDKQMVIYRI